MLFLFFICLLLNICNSDLVSDRLENAYLWLARSHSNSDMAIGYGPNVTTDNVCHMVQTVGDFCGRDLAKEYDSVVLDIQILGQIAPIIVWTIWNPSTIKWLTTDVLEVDFEMNITTAYDYSTGQYLVNNQTARLREYITFLQNSSLITIGYTVHDDSANKMFALSNSVTPNNILCEAIIFPACNVSDGQGGNYLTDTAFSTTTDCETFMNALTARTDPCPYESRSNTTACRILHGISAFLRPDVHCAHVRPYDSVVCTDTCLPTCSNCHQFAECIATHPGIPTNFTTVFECQCNNGYIGNGTYCEPIYCDKNNHCPALRGSYDCSTGLCKCTDTFVSQPENFGKNNLCVCPDESNIYTNNSLPVCVPVGKCLNNQWECKVQVDAGQINQVQCMTYGVNTFATFKDCVCNYNYTGGWEYPCVCDPSRREVWSTSFNGELCLSPHECTDDWHCTDPQTCYLNSGPIGTCQ